MKQIAFHAVNRGRYQLLAVIFFAIVVPLCLRLLQPGFINVPGLINTTLICSVMLIASFLIWRQLSKLPSVTGLMYVFWSFIPVYTVTLFAITMMRLDYNRFLLLMSFIIGVSWFMFVQFMQGRYAKMRFLVIPGGKVGRITGIRRAKWLNLAKPVKLPLSQSELNRISETQKDGEQFRDSPFMAAIGRNGIVADLRHNHDTDWERFIAGATLEGIPVYHYKQLEEKLTGRVSIDHLSENSFGSVLPDSSYLKMKQFLDFAVTLALLPLLLPVIGVIAIVIRLQDGKPVLFPQKRVGYKGKIFTAYKFRTMRANWENEPGHQEGISRAMTGENDPRITPIGQILRKTRLDELPQAINILKGEMSWIGPRPEVCELSDHYAEQIPFYSYRHAVRPGISGWAQVNQGHVTSVNDINEKLKLDFFYIKNVSLLLDFIIVLKTMRTMLVGKGAR